MQASQELILKRSQLGLLILGDHVGGDGSELVDINSRKPLAQDCGREGRVIAAAVQERIKAYCTREPSTCIQVLCPSREGTEEAQMGTGAAEGLGRGGSRVKMVRECEQHEERPRGRKPPWK